jgi:hypothetical protein
MTRDMHNSEMTELLARIRNEPPMTEAERAALQVSWFRREMGLYKPTPTTPQRLDRRRNEAWAREALVYIKWGWITVAVVALAVVSLALVFGAV